MENDGLNEIYVHGKLTSKEFIQYNILHTKKFRFRYFWLVYFLLFLLILLDIPFYLTDSLLITAVVALFIALLVIWLVKRLIIRRAAKEYDSDTLIQQEIHITIHQQGITQEIKGRTRSFYEWGNIVKGYESKYLFLLYVSKNKAILLPKRFFRTEADMEQFKRMTNQKGIFS